jgi:hypothetical protein
VSCEQRSGRKREFYPLFLLAELSSGNGADAQGPDFSVAQC